MRHGVGGLVDWMLLSLLLMMWFLWLLLLLVGMQRLLLVFVGRGRQQGGGRHVVRRHHGMEASVGVVVVVHDASTRVHLAVVRQVFTRTVPHVQRIGQ